MSEYRYSRSDGFQTECPECKGSGEVTYLHGDSREWGPDFRDIECEACNGEGWVAAACPRCHEPIADEPCPDCGGCPKCAACWDCADCGTHTCGGGEDPCLDGEAKLCDACYRARHDGRAYCGDAEGGKGGTCQCARRLLPDGCATCPGTVVCCHELACNVDDCLAANDHCAMCAVTRGCSQRTTGGQEGAL